MGQLGFAGQIGHRFFLLLQFSDVGEDGNSPAVCGFVSLRAEPRAVVLTVNGIAHFGFTPFLQDAFDPFVGIRHVFRDITHVSRGPNNGFKAVPDHGIASQNFMDPLRIFGVKQFDIVVFVKQHKTLVDHLKGVGHARMGKFGFFTGFLNCGLGVLTFRDRP